MKIKSTYLEGKGYTINEFRNLIMQEAKNRGIYGLSTRAYKFTLVLNYGENKIYIPYRALERGSIKDIVDFYEEDIKDLIKKEV